MVRLFFYLASFCLLIGCDRSTERLAQEEAADTSFYKKNVYNAWPTGQFDYVTEKGVYTEVWEKKDSLEINGRGCFTVESDTLFSMRMRMLNINGSVKMYYLVSNQNGGKETEFTLTHCERKRFVFENPFRSFPSVMSTN
jgi:hypothetical protein